MGSTFKTLETVSHFNFGYLNVVLDYYRDTFRGNKIGAAIPHLNKNLFKSLLVGIPPIPEQARIVAEIEKYEPLMSPMPIGKTTPSENADVLTRKPNNMANKIQTA